jgi:hypothetical protein
MWVQAPNCIVPKNHSSNKTKRHKAITFMLLNLHFQTSQCAYMLKESCKSTPARQWNERCSWKCFTTLYVNFTAWLHILYHLYLCAQPKALDINGCQLYKHATQMPGSNHADIHRIFKIIHLWWPAAHLNVMMWRGMYIKTECTWHIIMLLLLLVVVMRLLSQFSPYETEEKQCVYWQICQFVAVSNVATFHNFITVSQVAIIN